MPPRQASHGRTPSSFEDVEEHQGRLLLPFQRNVLAQLMPAPEHSSTGDALLLMARGLGMRSIVSTVLRVYDSSDYLVIIVNATPDEERSFAEELGMRVKVVGFELSAATREVMYKQGGIFSVTSRILTVDMLNKKLPIELVTGLIVMHAESVTPESSEAFVVRIYRQWNKDGFLKAFSDRPEQFTFGISPLQTVLQQLKLRQVIIVPRFHSEVDLDLQKRKADVVELYQPLSTSMKEIQTAILECMEATLSEIKRSNTYLEIEDFTVENALFKSFDVLVRKQLEPVWHKVGPRTRGYVADLATLRNLQRLLLSLDSVTFLRYLETLLSSQSDKKEQAAWLFTSAADTIISSAKKRVYIQNRIEKATPGSASASNGSNGHTNASGVRSSREMTIDGFELPHDLEDDEFELDGPTEEEEEMLRQLEQEEEDRRQRMGLPPLNPTPILSAPDKGKMKVPDKEREKSRHERKRPKWLPPGVEVVLEEQPKWLLLADVLAEVENEMQWGNVDLQGYSNDTILIMCSSTETCSTLGEYLSSRTDDEGGRTMLMSKLQSYFYWKGSMGKMQRALKSSDAKKPMTATTGSSSTAAGVASTFKAGSAAGPTKQHGTESVALKRKQEWQRGQAPSTKRRRVRGGGNVGSSGATGGPHVPQVKTEANPVTINEEAGQIADFFESTEVGEDLLAKIYAIQHNEDMFDETEFQDFFGIVSNEDLVIIRPYSDDDDDRMLEEIRPKYVIMYDPDPSFVRRLEAYRAAHGNCALRVYFLVYKDSVEEQKYLSSIRKEKDAFERLIRERGNMAITLEAEYRPGEDESNLLRSVNTRRAGGRTVETEPPRIIVDVRELRSSLPGLLHLGGFEILPLTIGVGDYVITPDMAVERKALPDLIQSFNSGRLFQQCEIMTAHYQQPILLIEFDEKRSFNLEGYAELKPTSAGTAMTEIDLRSKIVMLTIAFPRLKIIWSSSPYETVLIFTDLKKDRKEPDPERALLVGVPDEDVQSVVNAAGTIPQSTSSNTFAAPIGESGLNTVSQEVLRNLPGISTKNYRYVMNKTESIETLVDLGLNQVQAIVGNEFGGQLYRFINHDVRSELD
ncbi:DNA repair protein RAD16 [Microbotryomycetes sp. JL201]|nr:DNA repair protein RAD16 [Microbotryomycetes sp. JL201]